MFYHIIIPSSIIILMLYIWRNLRLNTTNAPEWANYLDLPLYMALLFHSCYVMLWFVRNMKIFCSDDLFWFISAPQLNEKCNGKLLFPKNIDTNDARHTSLFTKDLLSIRI